MWWENSGNELGLPSTTLFVVDTDLPLLDCNDQLGLVRTGFSWSSKF